MQEKYHNFFKKSVIDWYYINKFSNKKIFKNKKFEENYIFNLDENYGKKLTTIITKDLNKDDSKIKNLRIILKEMYLKIDHPFLSLVANKKRLHFLKTITQNEYQLLRDAELLNIDNEETENWWLELKNFLKKKQIEKKLDSGDEGEEASYNFEKKKLKYFGINYRPKRVSIEDDNLGYDIESWSKENGDIKKIYIEVKNNAFIFKSGQWREAQSKKDSYFAHFWTKNCKLLKIINFTELQEAVTKQIKVENPPGYYWTLQIPFEDGKPVEEYF